MTVRKILSIVAAAFGAVIVAGASFVALGLFLGQPLKDMHPEFSPLVNVGAIVIMVAIAIATFRLVFQKLHGSGGPGVG